MSTIRKVVMVTTSYPRFDGDHAGHFVAALAESLAEDGLQVTVLAPHESGAPEVEEVRGVAVRRIRYLPDSFERLAYGSGIVPNLKRDPRAWVGLPALRRALGRALREYGADADVIHVHWAPTALLASAATSAAGKPLVMTLHGSDVSLARRGGVWKRMLVTALAASDGAIVVSNEQAELIREEKLFSGPLEVIPSGIPAGLAARAIHERPAGDPFTFIYAGRLIESKGVLDLVEAFTALDARFPAGVRLVLAGSGPLESRLRERIVARRLVSEVRFAGHLSHDQALEAIRCADALVLPSYGEGSPLVVVEALALGTPVIGTSVGAVGELVAGDGAVVSPGDVGSLEEAMAAWIEDPDAARSAGARARERVLATHGWSTLAARTVGLYEAAASARSSGDGRGGVSAEVDL